MFPRAFAVALTVGILSTSAAWGAERTFERTLSVTSTPNVSVNTGSGNVYLHPGSDTQIHIMAHLHGNKGWFDGSSDIESRMQQIVANPPIQQSGSSVTVGERNHDAGSLYRNISIDYDITLPRGAAISADTGSGDVTIEDVGTSLKANTSSGNLRANGIHGTASLETGSGNIDLQHTAGGDVRAHTGSGNLHLEGVNNGLRADTGSGDITIDGNPTDDWHLETGSGNIRMNLGAGARFNLNANTGSGSFNIAQPITMQGSLDKHHMAGTVNGGGPTLQAGTGSGDIEIR